MLVYSEKCATYDYHAKIPVLPEVEHDCPYNYKSGLSKAMEASAALEIVTTLWENINRTVSIEYITLNDDITMRTHLTHATNNIHGKSPLHMPHPYFLLSILIIE